MVPHAFTGQGHTIGIGSHCASSNLSLSYIPFTSVLFIYLFIYLFYIFLGDPAKSLSWTAEITNQSDLVASPFQGIHGLAVGHIHRADLIDRHDDVIDPGGKKRACNEKNTAKVTVLNARARSSF